MSYILLRTAREADFLAYIWMTASGELLCWRGALEGKMRRTLVCLEGYRRHSYVETDTMEVVIEWIYLMKMLMKNVATTRLSFSFCHQYSCEIDA